LISLCVAIDVLRISKTIPALSKWKLKYSRNDFGSSGKLYAEKIAPMVRIRSGADRNTVRKYGQIRRGGIIPPFAIESGRILAGPTR
jgi:hypothetical protein